MGASNDTCMIGERIKGIRHSLHLTKTKFATSIGLSLAALVTLERGETKPSKPVLEVIELKHGYRREWVLTGNEPVYVPDFPKQAVVLPFTGYETTDRAMRYWFNVFKRIFESGDQAKIEELKQHLRALDTGIKMN